MISMRSAFLLALASSASLLPAAAFAQTETPPADETATSDDSGLGDIIVTARRREENLQSVPIAVTGNPRTPAAGSGCAWVCCALAT